MGIRESELLKERYSVKEAADMVGVTSPTIIAWHRKGLFDINKITGKLWVLEREELLKLLKLKNLYEDETSTPSNNQTSSEICEIVVYSDSSCNSLKEINWMEKIAIDNIPYGHNISFIRASSDIYGGKRAIFIKLLQKVVSREVTKIYILKNTKLPTKDKRMFFEVCEILGVKIQELDYNSVE